MGNKSRNREYINILIVKTHSSLGANYIIENKEIDAVNKQFLFTALFMFKLKKDYADIIFLI